jgi:hypothetical protein
VTGVGATATAGAADASGAMIRTAASKIFMPPNVPFRTE